MPEKKDEPSPGAQSTPGLIKKMAPLAVDDLLTPGMHKVDQVRVLLTTISRHLFYALLISLAIGGLIVAALHWIDDIENVTLPIAMICGIVGGFVSIQQRLRDLTIEDLKLLADSRFQLILAPFVGGVLAIVLYVLFLSGLLDGDLFPDFTEIKIDGQSVTGFGSIMYQHADDYTDYAKLMFWCFVAGFSERFVTDVIGKFEGKAVKSIE